MTIHFYACSKLSSGGKQNIHELSSALSAAGRKRPIYGPVSSGRRRPYMNIHEWRQKNRFDWLIGCLTKNKLS